MCVYNSIFNARNIEAPAWKSAGFTIKRTYFGWRKICTHATMCLKMYALSLSGSLRFDSLSRVRRLARPKVFISSSLIHRLHSLANIAVCFSLDILC
jgi:hypothetical protein